MAKTLEKLFALDNGPVGLMINVIYLYLIIENWHSFSPRKKIPKNCKWKEIPQITAKRFYKFFMSSLFFIFCLLIKTGFSHLYSLRFICHINKILISLEWANKVTKEKNVKRNTTSRFLVNTIFKVLFFTLLKLFDRATNMCNYRIFYAV